MDQEFTNLSSYTKQQSSSSPKKKAFLYVLLFVVLIGGAIFAGNYFFSTQNATQEDENAVAQTTEAPTETPTPTEEASTSATPSPKASGTPTPTSRTTPSPTEPVAAKLRIEVLNGSGTSGEASKMASFLKDLGYAISSTGNAETFDYTKTVIQIKKSKNSALAQLKKDLGTGYTVDPTTQTLAESATPDAIVIVGAE